MGFEERFGTQWTVWVGGVALALGGFFLVRYSIEQGWFGPGMRVFLGALLALALIAAGEWARRKETLTGIGGVPAAHIPSILTAAGTAVAYADICAAYRALRIHRRPAPPSSCSASSRSGRWPPRWCTARRSPASAWSAPM